MVRTVNSDILLLALLAPLLLPVTAADNITLVPGENPADAGTDMPYDIRIFIPTQRMIHADQINDLISGPDGGTIIGTSFGLSTYNGSWSTRHRNLNNISEGLMDDYITAVELDSEGNLWIGYSGGIQIYDGSTYRSIRDQQLLKETRIKDLQRWNNDMWVATGHAGIHRYRGGTWTWYQPMTRNGPPFYEVRSMALDVRYQTLVIVTEVEGLCSCSSRETVPCLRRSPHAPAPGGSSGRPGAIRSAVSTSAMRPWLLITIPWKVLCRCSLPGISRLRESPSTTLLRHPTAGCSLQRTTGCTSGRTAG